MDALGTPHVFHTVLSALLNQLLTIPQALREGGKYCTSCTSGRFLTSILFFQAAGIVPVMQRYSAHDSPSTFSHKPLHMLGSQCFSSQHLSVWLLLPEASQWTSSRVTFSSLLPAPASLPSAPKVSPRVSLADLMTLSSNHLFVLPSSEQMWVYLLILSHPEVNILPSIC